MTELALRRQRRQQLFRWWGLMLLAAVLLGLAISTRYFTVAQLDTSPAALAFRAVMLIGHLTVMSALLLSPIALLSWLWPQPRWVIAAAVPWTVAVLLALLVDTQVYQLYRFHINAGVLNLLFGGAARETFAFSSAMYVQAFVIVAAAILTVTAIAALAWTRVLRSPPRPALRRTILGAAVACTVTFHAAHIWADVHAYEPVLEQTSVLPLRYAATAKRFLRAHGVQVRVKPSFRMPSTLDRTNLSYPLRPLDCRPFARPNILFIVVDSWRFDAMDEKITPHVAAFGQRAVRFTDHHSGGNATRIGIFSLFYSIPGTYWHQMLGERRGPVFIEELLRQGYAVHAFRSAPLFSPEFDRTVFASVPDPRLRSDGADAAERDKDLTEDFLGFLRARQDTEPFFALLFYDAPHAFHVPKDYPEVFRPTVSHVNYLRLRSDSDAEPLLNRYRNSLHYVDGLIGQVLEAVEERGLFENTVIVVTGDHGQEFNDSGHNYWGHGSNFTRYQTGVPFLLYSPGGNAGLVTHRTTHFDVAPSLMREHLGCTTAASAFSVGHDLLVPGGREPLVLSEYADFAIVQHDRIAVVRKHGMQLFAPDYSELDGGLDPAVARAALEQKTRFYKSAPL